MTENERVKVGEIWLSVAAVYGKEIPRMGLKLMLDSINSLPCEKVCTVLNNWIKNKKNKTYPLPGDIIEEINPSIDPQDLAFSAMEKVSCAVKKFGNGFWEKENSIENFLGKDIWDIVKYDYSALCQSSKSDFIWSDVRKKIESSFRLKSKGFKNLDAYFSKSTSEDNLLTSKYDH